MKIRIGFVSNSSSSSFCIVGYELDTSEIKELGQKFLTPAQLQEVEDGDCNVGEYFTHPQLRLWEDWEGEQFYLGIPWPRIQDDETALAFKVRVTNLIREIFPSAECGTHSGIIHC